MLPSPPYGSLPPLLSAQPGSGAPKEHPRQRSSTELTFLATVALRFETPLSIGETPEGVCLELQIHGTVRGPKLTGRLAPSTAHLLIDSDGVGFMSARGPLKLASGALAELEANGRCDFGDDGYRRAITGDFPTAPLGWCPRLVTGDPSYLWLNRAQCLGVGELRLKEMRADWDLFIVRLLSP
jgi:Protein of unknown function (DUF3237)